MLGVLIAGGCSAEPTTPVSEKEQKLEYALAEAKKRMPRSAKENVTIYTSSRSQNFGPDSPNLTHEERLEQMINEKYLSRVFSVIGNGSAPPDGTERNWKNEILHKGYTTIPLILVETLPPFQDKDGNKFTPESGFKFYQTPTQEEETWTSSQTYGGTDKWEKRTVELENRCMLINKTKDVLEIFYVLKEGTKYTASEIR